MDIRLRCLISSPGLPVREAAFTENISRTGMLLTWTAGGIAAVPPATGQIVTVDIELPAHHSFGQKCIHCQGTVVRVSEEEGQPRVALNLNCMKFRNWRSRVSPAERLRPVAVSSWAGDR